MWATKVCGQVDSLLTRETILSICSTLVFCAFAVALYWIFTGADSEQIRALLARKSSNKTANTAVTGSTGLVAQYSNRLAPYYDGSIPITQHFVDPLEGQFSYFGDETEDDDEDDSVYGKVISQKTDDAGSSDSTGLMQTGTSRNVAFQTKSEDTTEVWATLEAAVHYREIGKHAKAKRLLEHALALAPSHPDVLIEYGLYMENVDSNVIEAETMYTRALAASPHHKNALLNRERTAPLVEDIDNKMLLSIDEKRLYFLSIPRQNAALRRAMKDSYFSFIYHTVAIEGNSMNFIQTRSVLETRLAVAGKSVVEHNEILGMDAALRYLNRTLINRLGGISMEDILGIHRRVLGHVDPMQAGEFRNTQVYVGKFVPVHPLDVQSEMKDFIAWMNDESTVRLHPVELAALAHYKFVYIHPFIDGNGRTARLLMNLILMQAGFPPVIIRLEDRLEYYETLTQANNGDLRPFIRFIARATDRCLQQYLDAVTVYKTTVGTEDDAKSVQKATTTTESCESTSTTATTTDEL